MRVRVTSTSGESVELATATVAELLWRLSDELETNAGATWIRQFKPGDRITIERVNEEEE